MKRPVSSSATKRDMPRSPNARVSYRPTRRSLGSYTLRVRTRPS
jgi:hypothetical protein